MPSFLCYFTISNIFIRLLKFVENTSKAVRTWTCCHVPLVPSIEAIHLSLVARNVLSKKNDYNNIVLGRKWAKKDGYVCIPSGHLNFRCVLTDSNAHWCPHSIDWMTQKRFPKCNDRPHRAQIHSCKTSSFNSNANMNMNVNVYVWLSGCR